MERRPSRNTMRVVQGPAADPRKEYGGFIKPVFREEPEATQPRQEIAPRPNAVFAAKGSMPFSPRD